MNPRYRWLAVLLVLAAAPALRSQEPKATTLHLKTGAAGAVIDPGYTGVSYEIQRLLPDEDGTHYFRADNAPLLAVFRTLGITHLRIGGNTSDRDARTLPAEADIDRLFAFAKAAHVKVTYGLRLLHASPAENAAIVRYIQTRYADLVDCFAIGQEASAYPTEKTDTRPAVQRMGTGAEKYRYEDYTVAWRAQADAILAAVPSARLSGPGVHHHGEWTRRFIEEYAGTHNLGQVTVHLYAGGAGNQVTDPAAGRDRMLSEAFTRVYQKFHDDFVPLARARALPYRLDETNSYYNGGAAQVSNTFAAALWSLDYLHWWAAHGAAGVDFHTGDRVAAGSLVLPSKYAAFVTAPGGYKTWPVGYGMLAFSLGAQGRSVPVTATGGPLPPGISAYATLGTDGRLRLTLINKSHGLTAQDHAILFTPDRRYASARSMSLAAPGNDIAAMDGLSLGGAPVEPDGRWTGKWTDLPAPGADGLNLALPAATALVVELGDVRLNP